MIREATIADIPGMQVVRHAVKENVLSDPALVTDQDCEKYLTVRGKGWVYEVDHSVIGFAIADLEGKNIWALFLLPGFEGRGIGTALQNTMLNWYFSNTGIDAWLTTAPGTRAEMFYRRSGWVETGRKANGEIRFEMTRENWKNR